MKVIQVLSTAMLFLLPGAIVSAYAQEHEPEKQPEQKQQPAKPAPQQAKPAPQQAKPAAQPQHAEQQPQAKPAPQQAKPAAQPQHAQQQPQAKPAPQQAKPAAQPQHAQQAKPAQEQAKPAQQQARASQQQARPTQAASGHGRIPDDRYRASCGSGHTFHVNQSDFAGGAGRFQYGGFWFSAINPWPVGWPYTDNVYVEYMDGGYFLCDPIHPGVFLSINIA
jgi:hypothetical protein